jgi:outer membrane receptor protein involved in Fe transport
MVRLGCVGMVVVMLVSPAWAQQAPAEQPPPASQEQTTATPPPPAPADPLRLTEQVEVTATRSMVGREMSPASSSVVLRADLELRNVVTVDQALSTVEGVYAYRTRGVSDNEMGIGMRGFSGRGTSQGRVLILLDGQPINNGYSGAVNWTALALSEVDRVEVVRGPFSSLYGGNAMGGVVNVMTRPINRRSADLSLQYGTYDTRLLSGRAGARVRERLGLGVAFEALTSDGYRTQEVLRTSTDSTATGGTPVTGVTRFLTRTGGVNYAVGLRGQNEYDRYAVRARAEYTFGPRAFGSFQYIRQANEYGWGAYETSVRDGSGRALDTGNVIFGSGSRSRHRTISASWGRGHRTSSRRSCCAAPRRVASSACRRDCSKPRVTPAVRRVPARRSLADPAAPTSRPTEACLATRNGRTRGWPATRS